MPFSQQIPRLFIRALVEALTPGQMGIYGLMSGNRWIYIGSGDIRERLLDHLNGDNPCIKAQKPTHWVYFVTLNGVAERNIAILAHDPICNRHAG